MTVGVPVTVQPGMVTELVPESDGSPNSALGLTSRLALVTGHGTETAWAGKRFCSTSLRTQASTVHSTGPCVGTFDGNVDTSGCKMVWRIRFATVTTAPRMVWPLAVDDAGVRTVDVVAAGVAAVVDTAAVAVDRMGAWFTTEGTVGVGLVPTVEAASTVVLVPLEIEKCCTAVVLALRPAMMGAPLVSCFVALLRDWWLPVGGAVVDEDVEDGGGAANAVPVVATDTPTPRNTASAPTRPT